MPTYKYRREDGTTFTIRQKITADALEECPDTGQKVERVIQPANFHLKGSGFYSTDYKDRGGPKNEGNGAEGNGAENKTESSSDAQTNGAAAKETS